MKFALLVFLTLVPCAMSAHDVPDNVSIKVFLKPDGDRLRILFRIPANALIDILFPMRTDGPWLDLKQIDGFATAGANVWVADLLSVYEGKNLLPRPQVIAARVSRANSSFDTYDSALDHMNGERLSSDTLLSQDEAEVDSLLETPIQSVHSIFSFEPRFERVGVQVTTTLVFLPADGGIRRFEYEGDPEMFELNPTWKYGAVRFSKAGFTHYLSETDYWLFLLCVVLGLRRFRGLAAFSGEFVAAQSIALLGSLLLVPSEPWLPLVYGILIAAATVYLGFEAIVPPATENQSRHGIVAGLIFGSGFWFGLQPIIQFGGAHRITSALGFDAGIFLGEICALALIVAAVQAMLRSTRAKRAAVIIAAAIPVHISWHRMLNRAHSLTLLHLNLSAMNPAAFIMTGILVAILMVAVVYHSHRSKGARISQSRA